VTRLFDETEKQLGSIDIVVNVAGVSVFKPHVDLTDVVAFLVGDDAHWMTGQNLQVNGGIL
jgi:NAD(P)-dependent dehydrogenase (short-subunit alcohol dehydrogenase family)